MKKHLYAEWQRITPTNDQSLQRGPKQGILDKEIMSRNSQVQRRRESGPRQTFVGQCNFPQLPLAVEVTVHTACTATAGGIQFNLLCILCHEQQLYFVSGGMIRLTCTSLTVQQEEIAERPAFITLPRRCHVTSHSFPLNLDLRETRTSKVRKPDFGHG